METYNTEEEQLEALRRWWDDNGKALIVGVVIAISASLGWQYWQKQNLAQRESASVIYQSLLQSTATGTDRSALKEQAQRLVEQFPSTSYGKFGALFLASHAVAENNLGEAQKQLRWVLSNSPSADERQVAQLRLARVQAAMGDTDTALAILTGEEPGPYAASYAIAEGDTLMMAGKQDQAKLAYEKARLLLEQVEGAAVPTLLLQKLDRLSPVPPSTSGSDDGE